MRQRQTTQISNATLYDTLFQMDRSNALRQLQLQEGINGVNDRLTKHEERHTVNERASVVGTELKLDAKKVGILGVLASLSVVLAGIIKELAGKQGWPF